MMAESVSVATTVEATFDVDNYHEDEPFKTTYLNTMLQWSALVYSYQTLRDIIHDNEATLPENKNNTFAVKFIQPELIYTQLVDVEPMFEDTYMKYPVTAVDILKFIKLNRRYLKDVDGTLTFDREGDSHLEPGGDEKLSITKRLMQVDDEYDADIIEFDDEFVEEGLKSELVYSILVNRTEKRITVIFRGSTSPKDFLTDATMTKTNPEEIRAFAGEKVQIHTGFSQYLFGKNLDAKGMSKLDQILSVLKQLYAYKEDGRDYSDYGLYITGHSLGGALSQVLAFTLAGSLENTGLPLKRVHAITYASPRCGDDVFGAAFASLEREGKLRHIRVSNEGDVVPVGMGPGFTQTGVNLHVSKDERVKVGYNINKPFWSQFGLDSGAKHSLNSYHPNLFRSENGNIIRMSIDELYSTYAGINDVEMELEPLLNSVPELEPEPYADEVVKPNQERARNMPDSFETNPVADTEFKTTYLNTMLQWSALVYSYQTLRDIIHDHEVSLPENKGNEDAVAFNQPELIYTQLVDVEPIFKDTYMKYPVTAENILKFIRLNRGYLKDVEGTLTFDEEGDADLEKGGMQALGISTRLMQVDDEYDADIVEFDDENVEEGLKSELVFSVLVNRTEKRITVIFRGSVSSKDFLTDATMTKTNPEEIRAFAGEKVQLHTGFSKYLFGKNLDAKGMSKLDQILSVLKQLYAYKEDGRDYSDYELYITGHSLGGALSQVLAFTLAGSLETTGLPVKRVHAISYASPRCGDYEYNKLFSSLEREGKLRHIRISNQGDIVPVGMGPGFTQTGVNLHVYPDKRVFVGYNVNRTFWSQISMSSGALHSLTSYHPNLFKSENADIIRMSVDELYDKYAGDFIPVAKPFCGPLVILIVMILIVVGIVLAVQYS